MMQASPAKMSRKKYKDIDSQSNPYYTLRFHYRSGGVACMCYQSCFTTYGVA